MIDSVKIIMMFTMVAMMSMFTMVFFYEMGDTEILDPILNTTLTIEQQQNVSSALQTHASDLKTTYENIIIPYDLFFLSFWASTFIATIGISIRTRKMSPLSFLGGLFWGIIMLLLIVFFIDQVQSWFFTNIFDTVFSDTTVNKPIMDFYFSNLGIIAAVWMLILLLVNQIEFNFLGGRFEQ